MNYNKSYYKDFENAFNILEQQYGSDEAIILIQNAISENNYEKIPEGDIRDIIRNLNQNQFTTYIDMITNPKNEVITEAIDSKIDIKFKNIDEVFEIMKNEYGETEAIQRLVYTAETGDFKYIPKDAKAKKTLKKVGLETPLNFFT